MFDNFFKNLDLLFNSVSEDNRKNLYSCAVHYLHEHQQKMMAVSVIALNENDAKQQARLAVFRLKPTAVVGTIVISCATTELIDVIKREC